MKKRTANKILEAIAAGRSQSCWKRSTVLKANDTLFGKSNRGMLSFMSWAQEASGSALAFARSIEKISKAIKPLRAALQPFTQQTNQELAS